ncbi:MAG: hypothetical protein IPP70_07115 [Elusimicrobia bacterium]|nr:hypothetical protein [Elusimicrobiota bacterium]
MADGFDAVVAIGGDGTINEVARALVGTPAALGILPKGSGNGLAREFNIPLDPTAAARALPAYRPLAIDVGRVNGELFSMSRGSASTPESPGRLKTASRAVAGVDGPTSSWACVSFFDTGRPL